MPRVTEGSRFVKVRDLFLRVLDLPDEVDRRALIVHETDGDPETRRLVESLLANHKADLFLEIPPTELPRGSDTVNISFASSLSHQEKAGDVVGRYRLLEQIGEGGCGTVYLAEQLEPVRRRVALKVIKLGMETQNVVARFEAERQALAMMDHPNIARVFDAGATQMGRPFFVMELVRGVRITEYCDEHALSLTERIVLFTQLCHAIQHAHQKGVIHRDIKPSNVLVTIQDGKPELKVIDFGIAKAVEEPLTEKTILTNFHAFIGTPAYTSPEQAEMAAGDVDTRSDIYSLGVLLYELLTGVTPFDPKELTRSGFDEMRRIIKEVEPAPPSTRFGQRLRASRVNGGKKMTRLDRDLDWIIMKCLEKDRTRRYSTAQGLADDLQRYLKNEPVEAKAPSRSYRFKKAFLRNRGAFAAAASIVVALLIGAGLSLWQAVRATRAERGEFILRKNAERERERALQNQRRAEENEYVADINLAHQAIVNGNVGRAVELLSKHRNHYGNGEQRAFEWKYLWKLSKGDPHKLFTQAPGSILSLSMSRGGETLIVGTRAQINVYDFESARISRVIRFGGQSIALSPEGVLVAASPGIFGTWNANFELLWSLQSYSPPVAFSHDGTKVAVSKRRNVHIFDALKSELQIDLPDAFPPFTFLSEGERLVANGGNEIAVWNVLTGERSFTLDKSEGVFEIGWPMERPIIQSSPDGSTIVAARNSIRGKSAFALEVWDSKTGNHLFTMPGVREAAEHTGVISSVAFSPDGSLVATASWDHSIRVWDLSQRRCVRTFYGNLSEVWALIFSSDGKHVISGAKDGKVLIWPLETDKFEDAIPGNLIPLELSRDGQSLAAIDGNNQFRIIDVRTRESDFTIDLSPRARGRFLFPPVAVSADFRRLAEPLASGKIRVWNLEDRHFTELEGTGRRFDSILLSPDGNSLLAGVGIREGFLLSWDLRHHAQPPLEIEGHRAFFSADGKVLVVLTDSGFNVWDWTNKIVRSKFVVEPVPRHGTALSADGRILASASNPEEIENAIRLWDTASGNLIGICFGHTQGVGRLAFSPDNRTLASAGSDGTLRMWNIQTQQQLLEIRQLGSPFQELLFSKDGTCLFAKSSGDGALRIFRGADGE